jgi:hypothetical protein
LVESCLNCLFDVHVQPSFLLIDGVENS